jgi:ATP-dependent Clp protease ATP-binding subunit ClpA/CheY-like chemotaxis protein
VNPQGSQSSDDLITILSEKIVGQQGLFRHIVPYIRMYKAGMSPTGRPIGNFLLLGPTGTGKTRTVEALAEVLHGNYAKFVRIDCGEFQLEHEVAKLIGAPPGYMGHRETKPMLSDQRLKDVTSEGCNISLILFDEIEKAAGSLARLLLGVLDKATLQLGDNTSVNFEHSLIFLTSNLGAAQMMKELSPGFGFSAGGALTGPEGLPEKLESIALAAVKRKFSPEFVNRIDAVVTYQPLSRESLVKILQHQIDDLRQHLDTRLGAQSFQIDFSDGAREFLLTRGTSVEYGARELKRVMHRFVMQPLATLVAEGRIARGVKVAFDVDPGNEKLVILTPEEEVPAKKTESKPYILIVDDNRDLLELLRRGLVSDRWDVQTAGTVARGLRISSRAKPALAIVDYMLQDASGMSGLDLSTKLQAGTKLPSIIVMTGGQLSADEQKLCRKSGWLLLQKPFLMRDLLALIEGRVSGSDKAQAANNG